MLQLGFLGATRVAGIAAWIVRTCIIQLLNAGSEFDALHTVAGNVAIGEPASAPRLGLGRVLTHGCHTIRLA